MASIYFVGEGPTMPCTEVVGGLGVRPPHCEGLGAMSAEIFWNFTCKSLHFGAFWRRLWGQSILWGRANDALHLGGREAWWSVLPTVRVWGYARGKYFLQSFTQISTFWCFLASFLGWVKRCSHPSILLGRSLRGIDASVKRVVERYADFHKIDGFTRRRRWVWKFGALIIPLPFPFLYLPYHFLYFALPSEAPTHAQETRSSQLARESCTFDMLSWWSFFLYTE